MSATASMLNLSRAAVTACLPISATISGALSICCIAMARDSVAAENTSI
jgi:hypothetical protein